MILRRRRFGELVERQLALFEEDAHVLFDEVRAADAAWTNARAEESEELYGDYQLIVDSIGEQLHSVREAYATTLDEATADDYRAVFDRKATKRFGRFASSLVEGGI